MGLRFPAQIHGTCFFISTTYRNWRRLGEVVGFYQMQAETLIFCLEKYKADLIAYVFMPTHIHLLLIIKGIELGNFMRDFKKYVGQKVANDFQLGKGGLWMPRYDRVEIHSSSVLQTKFDYIHYNPVKSELVMKPEDWCWSSAGDYHTGNSGQVPIFRDWFV